MPLEAPEAFGCPQALGSSTSPLGEPKCVGKPPQGLWGSTRVLGRLPMAFESHESSVRSTGGPPLTIEEKSLNT